jgi:energy-coupling factor transport system ATP-binding protein
VKSRTPLIRIENLTQRYQDTRSILDGVNLTINEGDFLALIGQNGAGKTTLVKHLNGLLRPESGRIYISGEDISRIPRGILSQKVGYVFQNPDHQIFLERVDKEVGFGPRNLGLSPEEVKARTEKALLNVGIHHLAAASPMFLSKGERQRVALASILAMEPQIIILDEPTTGQDYQETTRIMEVIVELNQEGHTIILITHDMQLVAKYAQRAVLMGKGRILADGTPKEVFSWTALLQEAHLKVPQITRLARELKDPRLPGDIISVEEFLTLFYRCLTPEKSLADVI